MEGPIRVKYEKMEVVVTKDLAFNGRTLHRAAVITHRRSSPSDR